KVGTLSLCPPYAILPVAEFSRALSAPAATPSVARDDLALAAVNGKFACRIAGVTAHQESRTALGEDVATAAPRRRLAPLFLRQLRKPEDLAPHRRGRVEFGAVGADGERNGQRGIAVDQRQHLRFGVDAAQADADEVRNANVDGHPHAQNGTV